MSDADTHIGLTLNESKIWLTVGYSAPFPVNDAYSPPFRLDPLVRVVVDAGRPELPAFNELLEEIMRHQ